MKKSILISFMFACGFCFSQVRNPVPMVGDSVPHYLLESAVVRPYDKEFEERYREAKYYTIRIYDYAMIASAMLNEFEDSLSTMEKKWQKKKYLKSVNGFLKDEFGDEVESMSIKKGKYMMKIIHKETGLSTYQIIKTYNGGLKAIWWQSVVKVFGATLKHEYNPLGDDDALAKVIREIEAGEIEVRPRPPKTIKAQDSLTKKEKKKLKKKNKKNNKS